MYSHLYLNSGDQCDPFFASQARELQERAHVAEEPDGACIKRKKVASTEQI